MVRHSLHSRPSPNPFPSHVPATPTLPSLVLRPPTPPPPTPPPTQEKIELQIAELDKKIQLEKKIHEGAERLHESVQWIPVQRDQANLVISESAKRLEFLEGEKRKLLVKKGIMPGPAGATQSDSCLLLERGSLTLPPPLTASLIMNETPTTASTSGNRTPVTHINFNGGHSSMMMAVDPSIVNKDLPATPDELLVFGTPMDGSRRPSDSTTNTISSSIPRAASASSLADPALQLQQQQQQQNQQPQLSSSPNSNADNSAKSSSNRLGSTFFKFALRKDKSTSNAALANSTNGDSGGILGSGSRKPSLNNLDLSKASTTMTAEKVAVKLLELQNKVEIETRVKAGAEKLSQVFQEKIKQDDKLYEDVNKKLKLSTEKINLLKAAIQRYQGMFVEGLADVNGKLVASTSYLTE